MKRATSEPKSVLSTPGHYKFYQIRSIFFYPFVIGEISSMGVNSCAYHCIKLSDDCIGIGTTDDTDSRVCVILGYQKNEALQYYIQEYFMYKLR